MQSCYFDNGATSNPKAPGVGTAMLNYIENVGSNVNRASYAEATEAALTVLGCRERLCRMFHFPHVEHAVFTPGMTFGLNQVLKGYLREGDHVLVSAMEHNAMMRPLTQLMSKGVTFSRIPCDSQGLMDPNDILGLIRPNTRLVAMIHASNVGGGILPVKEVGRICRERGIPLLLDAAQSAGHLHVDFEELNLSALCVPGHKGLLGPSGIGAMLLAPEFAAKVEPLVTGGTGSTSDSEIQPEFFPDRFEAGTMNLPGVYGLDSALAFLEQEGTDRIHGHEMALCRRFMEGLEQIPGVRVAGPQDQENRVAVVSLDFPGRDNADAAFFLESEAGLHTRCGLHCAPNAHKTLGTYPQGTVRFSFGYWNTPQQVDTALEWIGRYTAAKG